MLAFSYKIFPLKNNLILVVIAITLFFNLSLCGIGYSQSNETTRLIRLLRDRNLNANIRLKAAELILDIKEHRVIEALVRTALSDKDWKVKDKAKIVLNGINDSYLVDLLIGALNDQYSDIRIGAIETLKEKKDSRTINSIINCLKDNDSNVRREAAKALAEIRDSRAVNALIIASKDQDIDVCREAIWALKEIGNQQAIKALTLALKDQDSNTHRYVLKALLDLKDNCPVIALIDALTDESYESYEYREETLEILSELKDPIKKNALVIALIDLLKHKHQSIRLDALRALKMINHPLVVDALIYALNDQDSYMRIEAVTALKEINYPYLGELLLDILKDSKNDFNLCMTAIYALRGRNDSIKVKALINASKLEDPDIVALAIKELSDINYSRLSDVLTDVFQNEDWILRRKAQDVLKLMKDSIAINVLIGSLKHENEQVREDAFRTLLEMRYPYLRKFFTDFLIDENWYIRRTVIDSLAGEMDSSAINVLIRGLSHKNHLIRADAIKALATTNYPRLVEVLSDALQDEEWEVRKTAINELAAIKDSLSVNTFIDLMKNEDPYVRQVAINSLAGKSDTIVVNVIIDALKDENPYVRSASIKALGEIRHPILKDLIFDFLKDEDWAIRHAALDILPVIKDSLSTNLLVDFIEYKNWEVRRAVINALVREADSFVVNGFISALKHKNPDVRKDAIEILAKINYPYLVNVLFGVVKDENHYVRKTAIDELKKINDSTAVNALVSALRDANPGVRRDAVEALADMKFPRLRELFIDAINDENWDVRRVVRNALIAVKDSSLILAFIRALNDENVDVREEAIEVLAEISYSKSVNMLIILLNKNFSAIDTLINALKDNDPNIRKNAVEILTEIKYPHLGDVLIDVVNDEDWHVRWRAIKALKEKKDSSSVKSLLNALKHKNSDVRADAINALAEIKYHHLGNVLIDFVRDENSNVRWAAINALKGIKDSSAVIALITALKDKSPAVRDEAIIALGNLKYPWWSFYPERNEEWYARKATIDMLARTKNSKLVKALISALKNEDPYIRESAIMVLSEINYSRLGNVLIDVLKDEELNVRKAAVFALMGIKDSIAVNLLISASKDEDYEIQELAERALENITNPRGFRALINALDDKDLDFRVRRAIVNSLRKQKNIRALPSLFVELIQLDKYNQDVPRNAISALLSDSLWDIKIEYQKPPWIITDGKVIEPLITALYDDSLNNIATQALTKIALIIRKGSFAVRRLINAALNDRNFRVRVAAVRALGEIEDPRLNKVLISALTDIDANVRLEAANALSKFNRLNVDNADLSTIDRLITALNDHDSNVRVVVVRTLGETKDPRAIKAVIAALNDIDVKVRLEAIEVLSKLDWSTANIICSAIEDEEEIVQKKVVEICVKFGKQAVNCLIAALNQPGSVQSYAIDGIIEIKDTSAVEPLIAILKNSNYKYKVIRVLGEFKDPHAIQPLIAELTDKYISNELEKILIKFGEPTVVPLIEVLAGHDDIFARQQAAKILGEIKDNRAIEPLINALTDSAQSVITNSKEALLKICEPAIDHLIAALKIGNQLVIEILSEIGDERAIVPLFSIVKDSINYTQKEAGWALLKIASRIKSGEPNVEPLIAALNSKDKYVQSIAIQTLKNLGGLVVNPLLVASNHEEKHIRSLSTQILGHIKDPGSTIPLSSTRKEKTLPEEEDRYRSMFWANWFSVNRFWGANNAWTLDAFIFRFYYFEVGAYRIFAPQKFRDFFYLAHPPPGRHVFYWLPFGIHLPLRTKKWSTLAFNTRFYLLPVGADSTYEWTSDIGIKGKDITVPKFIDLGIRYDLPFLSVFTGYRFQLGKWTFITQNSAPIQKIKSYSGFFFELSVGYLYPFHGRLPEGLGNTIIERAYFPNLSIRAIFIEPSKNGFLDRNETGEILLDIRNTGDEKAKNCIILVELENDEKSSSFLSYERIHTIGNIKPNRSKIYGIPISASQNISDKEFNFSIKIQEESDIITDRIDVSVKTKALVQSQVKN